MGLDGRGALRRLEMEGHADGFGTAELPRSFDLRNWFRKRNGTETFASRGNPACAAVTLVARSVARLAASRTGWTVDGDASEPGNLSLVIKSRPEDTDEWLLGVTDTLMQALADITEEYPGAISVRTEEM